MLLASWMVYCMGDGLSMRRKRGQGMDASFHSAAYIRRLGQSQAFAVHDLPLHFLFHVFVHVLIDAHILQLLLVLPQLD